MKNLLSIMLFILFSTTAISQGTFGDKILERTKEKAKERRDQKTETGIDKALDKAEEGILDFFKKKDKKKKVDQEEKNSENTIESESKPKVAKPVKSNSKFDFVAGEKELYFDNFNRLNIGDFPAEFNTNASGEIVNIDNQEGKWLSMTKNGAFVPENIKQLPNNFTLEFEIGINNDPTNNYTGFGLNFSTIKDNLMLDMFFSKGNSIVYLHPGAGEASIYVNPTFGTEISNSVKMSQWDVSNGNNFAKISLWRQDGRLRVYVNEDKLFDVPKFFADKNIYDFAFFRSFFDNCEVYITKIRFAVAGADTRNKLITEGKFVTNGILFDTNSDNIKPESGVVLKEMAAVLRENVTVRIKIIGHTDGDGDAKANLILSKKRAEAVKASLSNFYDIDLKRMETDGKGENEALNKNATPTEKATNRRVEFIKL